jgi:hypothetical protein
MKKKWIGIAVPLAISALAFGALSWWAPREAVRSGVMLGIGLALAQSFLALAALRRAASMRVFFAVWVGGVVMRLAVFGLVAFWVARFTNLNLMATLLSLVTATTCFLIVEAYGLLTD